MAIASEAETAKEELPTFDVIPLTSEVKSAVADLGYVHPTPVQRAVFESAARGKDLVVQARTGTGKTAAFGLPLVDRLVRTNPVGRLAEANEIADIALWLCDDATGYLTGQAITVDGGASA